MKKGIILITLLCSILMCSRVKADTYVGGLDEVWYDDENHTQQWTSGITYQYKTLQSSTSAWNNMQYFRAYASNQYSMTPFKGGHITIPFVFDFPLITSTDSGNSNITYYTCKTWTQQSSGTYVCTSYDDQSYVIKTTDYEYIPPVIQMNAYIEYTNGYNDNCEINFNTNYISCPVANREDLEIKNFLLAYKFLTTWSGNFKFGLGLKFNGWSNDINTITENQNQNTQTILDQNTTYNNTPTQDYENQTSEMENITNAEDTLMNNLDFNTTDMNITINPNASTFIWNIVDSLRLMSTKIVLLMTSILSLGIIKMVLNR